MYTYPQVISLERITRKSVEVNVRSEPGSGNERRKRIAAHYSNSGMAERVLSALTGEGMDIDALSWDRLTSFDQFHTRGLRRLGNGRHLPRRNRAKR